MMGFDTERMYQKIAFIKEQVNDIQTLTARKTYQEIFQDKFLVKGLKYALQTAIEAMIDIAYHLSVKKYHCAPEEARLAFQVLMGNGVISSDEYTTFSTMVGLRNRIVHLYQTVSDERLYEYATSELSDFEVFIEKIKALLG